MHGAFVILESVVERTRQRLMTSGRCHHQREVRVSIPASDLPPLCLPGTVRAEAGGSPFFFSIVTTSSNGQEIAFSSSPPSYKACTPINTLDIGALSTCEVQLLRELI